MKRSDTFSKIAPALVAALGKIEGAAKKAKNPHFKSTYANLETVIDASRDILTEHGLTVIQMPGPVVHGALTLETMIVHESGEWVEGSFEIPLGKTDPQGAGSALTYARRYALMAALNMPAVDDDGNAACGRQEPPQKPRADMGPSSEGPDFYGCEGQGLSAYQAKKDGLDKVHDELRHAASEIPNREALRTYCETHREQIARMPRAWRVELRLAVDERAAELGITSDRRAA